MIKNCIQFSTSSENKSKVKTYGTYFLWKKKNSLPESLQYKKRSKFFGLKEESLMYKKK